MIKIASSSIETKVENLLKSVIENLGYDLYDVIYEKEGKDYYLRIVIDKSDGIDINDCEAVNNAINDLLDEADIIKEQYFLEVSSPGVERTLRKNKHFESQLGNVIYVKLYKSIDKQKEFEGTLQSNTDDDIELKLDNNNNILKINKKDIAIAKTIFEW